MDNGKKITTASSLIGLALLSGCLISLEVVFTRVFSITIWYHFAYLVIGIALLGYGAAGTYLAMFDRQPKLILERLPKLVFVLGILVAVNFLIITQIHIDPLGGKESLLSAIPGLGVYFIAVFSIFFVGGLIIVSIFRVWSQQAHRLYFADLLGASIGTLIIMSLVRLLGGIAVIFSTTLVILLVSVMFSSALSRIWRLGLVLATIGYSIFLFYITGSQIVQLPIPQSKELWGAMKAVGVDTPEYTRWNPVARVDVLPPIEFNESLQWIIFGGLSSRSIENQQTGAHLMRFVTLDGTSITAMHEFDGDLSDYSFLKQAIVNAPYLVTPQQPSVLLIGAGGGLDILLARTHQANQITAVELNSDVVNLLKGPYADFSGHLSDDPRTDIVVAEGRSFLMREEKNYDLIQGIGVDNFAALSGGAYVLSESYLYTVEAMDAIIDHLTDDGVYSWTRFINDPPRETLRLSGLAAEALRRRGIEKPYEHIAIVSNENNDSANLLVSKSPMKVENVQALRDWTAENHFNLLHDPYNNMQTVYAEYLRSDDPRDFEVNYPYNITPVSDDNPYFYNYFKWSNLDTQGGESGDLNTRLPIGNLVLLVLLGFSSTAAVIFIVFPLLKYRRESLRIPNALSTLGYFSMLGLGYIFVEIIFIQRFTLFVGYPTRAITTTIFAMLFFSAIGSLVAKTVCRNLSDHRRILVALSILILVYVLGLRTVINALLILPDLARILVTVLLIAPVAFLMGMPFPVGLDQINLRRRDLLPWVWGVNGVFSVIGTTLVTFVSMQTSFTISLVCAGLFYVTALLLSPPIWRAD